MPTFPDKDLILAASRGDLPGAQAALAAGADPYFDNGKAIEAAITNGRLDKALKLAVIKGHEAVADRLLAAGADLHAEDDFCLQHAAALGNVPMIDFLVRHGADPDAHCVKAAAEKHASVRAWMDRRTIEAFCEASEDGAGRKAVIVRARI